MEQSLKLNDEITVGSQPTSEQLQELSREGFRTIVNFRNAGEDDASLSPLEEGDRVDAMGMRYLHVPVTMKAMTAGRVDQFRAKYPELPKPIFAHCKTGKRAGAMAIMNIAVDQGWTGSETLAKAEQIGLDCDQPELQEFIRAYVDARTNSSVPTA